jgi:hypothetical protein
MSGSGIDASIPLAAGRIGQGAGGNSLLANPSGLIDTMQKLQQMQLFPGQLQRQQQEIQQGGIGIEKAQQELRAYKNNLVANGMLPLFQKGDNATLADATNTLGQIQAGGYDTTGLTDMLHKSGATGGQPLLTALKSAVMQAHPELGVPKIEYQQIGDALVPVNTNPFAGNLGQMGPAMPMTLTPEQKAARTPVFSGGQAGSMPMGATVDRFGNPLPGGAPGAAAAPSAATGTPPAAGAATPPARPPGFIGTSAPLGTGEQVTANQAAYQADQRAVASKQNSVVNLDTAIQALKLTQSGMSTEAVHNFYSFLKAQGITPPFGDNNVTQYDIARKAMIGFAQQAAGAGGTDLSRMMSQDANANMHIDTDAAMHVLKQNLGLVNRDIGMVHEAPDQTGAGYLGHVMNFPLKTVPEAFAWDRLSEPERQAVRDRMAAVKGGTDMLHKSLEYAAKHNLIGLPNQPAAAGQ